MAGAGIYLVASWAVLQVVGTLAGVLLLPDWFEPLAFVLLIVGLPIVLATAFVQEGVSGPATDRAAHAPPAAADLFTWRNALLGGVGALSLLIGAGLGWVWFGSVLGTSDSARSVAVMPCDDLSPGEDQAALAHGIAEEVSFGLSQFPELKLSGRSSVLAMQAQDADLLTIASTLNVANVLQCTLVRDGDEVRLTAHLTDATNGSVLWSWRFDEQFTELFAVLDAMARAVTDSLQVVLAGGDDMPLVAEGTTLPVAREAYLRGRYALNRRTPETLRSAITEFERAVRLDPDYAEAYAGLADSYVLHSSYAGAENTDYYQRALDAAERAAQLAPDLGMAHVSLAFLLHVSGQWERAESAFVRAIELSPGYATAHHWYGQLLHSTGRPEEGVAHIRRALELDPVSPIISMELSQALWVAGRAAESIEQARETIQLDPAWMGGWGALAWALFETGEYDEGLTAWVTYWRLRGGIDAQAAEAAYKAAVQFRETGEPQPLPAVDTPGLLVWAYVKAGQTNVAIEQLEELMRLLGPGRLAEFSAWWGLDDELGDDPRYQALIDQAGITW